MAEFLPAFRFMLPHEGGYVNDPNDHGGETKFGICRRTYPNLDIAHLTEDDARAIYERDWWNSQPYAKLVSQAVANKVFDLAVNMGANRAHRILQQGCVDCGQNVVVDGKIGDKTLQAANAVPGDQLVDAMRRLAAAHYRSIAAANPNNQKFLNGWLNRANA